jgi:hypothetical protein
MLVITYYSLLIDPCGSHLMYIPLSIPYGQIAVCS